jgi:hypothetical protein
MLQSSHGYTSKTLFTNATYWIGGEKGLYQALANYEDPPQTFVLYI